MDPVDLLKNAVTAIEQADVPEDLRAIAFAKTLDLFLAAENDHSGGRSADGIYKGDRLHHIDVEQDPRITRIAAQLDLQPVLMDRIFDANEDGLIFCGDVSALGKTKSERVASLALLLIAARRWADLDGGATTADSIVRAEVDRLGLLDVSNYSKHITSLKSYITTTGRGKDASYKIKYDGLERAKHLGRTLAGVD